MIILNWLPPAKIEYPAIALSCLKRILLKNNYRVEIIYWNLLFKKWLDDYAEHNGSAFFVHTNEKSVLEMLLLMISCEDFYYSVNQAKLLVHLDAKEKGVVKNKIIPYIKSRILGFLQNKIHELKGEPLLFGTSAKYDQWLAAVFLSSLLKKQYPHIMTVMGGFLNTESANILLQKFQSLDFAIWGEAEIPLLSLCDRLKSRETDYSGIPRLLFRKEKRIIINKGSPQDTYIPYEEILNLDYQEFYSLWTECNIEHPKK